MTSRVGTSLNKLQPSTLSELESSEWLLLAAEAIEEKSGLDTVIVDVGDVFALTEIFLITSGRTNRQVKAIVEEVEGLIRGNGGPSPLRIEGNDEFKWVLMDYGEFLVHVFDTKEREYYQLERLWSDRPLAPFPFDQDADLR